MATPKGPSLREAKRLQTRERLLGAAIAEFKRSGMAAADVGAIVTAAGVAHGTFFFHFPTKEHVLLELERREEDRIAKQFAQFLKTAADLQAVLVEATRLVFALERRLGEVLFKDFLAIHFSQTRSPTEDGRDHVLVVLLGQYLDDARDRGEVVADVIPLSSAVIFLLGLYALAITTDGPARTALVDDLVKQTVRGIAT